MSIPDVLFGSTLSNFLSIFTAASATPLFTRGCGHYFILSFSCYLTNFLSCIIFSFIHRHHHINLELPYTMKLSENIIELERIFALITDATLFSEPSHHGYTRRLRLDFHGDGVVTSCLGWFQLTSHTHPPLYKRTKPPSYCFLPSRRHIMDLSPPSALNGSTCN
jgi:hypothetical protein